MRKLVFLAAAALAARWLADRGRTRQRRALDTPAARPEPIARWEGEGGGVPVGGGRTAAEVGSDELPSSGEGGTGQGRRPAV